MYMPTRGRYFKTAPFRPSQGVGSVSVSAPVSKPQPSSPVVKGNPQVKETQDCKIVCLTELHVDLVGLFTLDISMIIFSPSL